MKNSLFVVLIIIGGLSLSCNPNDNKTLVNSNWIVQSMEEPVSGYKYSETGYSLKFDLEKYYLNLDVNECTGTFKSENNGSCSFSAMGCAKICCDSIMALGIAEALPLVTTYEIDGKNLTLRGKYTLRAIEAK